MEGKKPSMSVRPHVLVVAGSDSSGGAGNGRDIEVLASLGVNAALAITAVTAQTHSRVAAVEPMSPSLVSAQMEAALEAEPIDAIKIGMLGTSDIVEAVSTVLRRHLPIPVVLDPVLASSSGGRLMEEAGIAVLKRELLPLCRLVTPNWLELAILAATVTAGSEEEALDQGNLLLASGCHALLVKGGHAPDKRNSTDILLRRGHAPERFEAPRLDSRMRGTGCALASSIAAALARGLSLEESIAFGKRKVYHLLREADAEHPAA